MTMTSTDCEEIERELNLIIKDLACHKSDASCSSRRFSVAEKYETDFPALNASHDRHHRNHNVGVASQVQNSFCDFVQEGRMTQTVRKPNERLDKEFHYRQQHNDRESHAKKRRDQGTRHRPQASRNISVNKLAPDRVQDQVKLASSSPYANSKTLIENEIQGNRNVSAYKQVSNRLQNHDKQIHKLVEGLDVERKASVNTSKKYKNVGHVNREKKANCPRGVNDKKIQANIFLNALTEVSVASDGKISSTVETTKRERPKGLAKDRVFCEPEEAACALMDEVPEDSLCNAKIFANNNNVSQGMTIVSNADSVVRTMSSSSSSSPLKDEPLAFISTDEFIRRCNKDSCSCSKESLFCTLCNFHMDNRKEYERHRKQVSHDIRKKDFLRVKSLAALSPPSRSNIAAIEELLLEMYSAHVQRDDDSKLRKQFIEELSEDLHSEVDRECRFHLFGSSVNGFGLKTSNVNIDLEVPQGISPSQMLLKSLDALKDRECKYGNITSDFLAVFPSISFIHRRTKLQCQITLNNEASRRTSRLLKQYAEFDDKAQKLGTIFRIWAKICGIDQQEACSLPPHCFPLMTVHFLQQIEPPVLPVFHELTIGKDPLLHDFRGFWISRNKQTLGELWINLLKFYATVFEYRAHVIAVCQTEPLLCKDKKWTQRAMCIEDPFHPKRNVARTIANLQWFQYILECIRSSYEYFCTCRVPEGQILPEMSYPSSYSNDEDEESLSAEENSVDNFIDEQDKDLQVESVINSIKNMDLGSQASGTSHPNRSRTISEQCHKVELTKVKSTLTEEKHLSDMIQPHNWEKSADAREQLYRFEKLYLVNVKPPCLYCRQCQKPNHVKKNCTVDEKLPELKKLPKMDKEHRDMLTDVCQEVVAACQISQQNIQENKKLLCDLERHIQSLFSDAQLELFGSSCNGFGFDDSDLDICLTFINKSGEDLDQKNIIEQLTSLLNRFHKVRTITPIPTAKVPIIKLSFYGRKEGDISLYNTLAQHNTRLLSMYCKIDNRVHPLGYALKFFAKKCDICDASRGSLSSYAYILMTIFYLQQLEIPVIPVLQELYDENGEKPERHVDNWNTWFFDDLDQLPKVWKDYGRNKQSIGELWLGLLVFYTEKFNTAEYVISIRQKAPLTRFEKLWNTRSIAIEDPFDLSHNLGAGVSRNMNTFIVSAFRRGRERFGRTPPARRDIPSLLGYFFDSRVLTDGEKPPNERGCRLCLKIGHKVKECPLRKNKRRNNFERRNNNRPQQRSMENKSQFPDRNRADRYVRGTFRTRGNQDHGDPRRIAPNFNSNTPNS